MPKFIVLVDAAQSTTINFKSAGDCDQLVDILNPNGINCLTVKLKSPSVAAGLLLDYISMGLSTA